MTVNLNILWRVFDKSGTRGTVLLYLPQVGSCTLRRTIGNTTN